MSLQQLLLITQIIVSIFLTATILLQAQGSGLGTTWGGGGETYHTRRGVEKVIFVATIIALACFILNSIALIITR